MQKLKKVSLGFSLLALLAVFLPAASYACTDNSGGACGGPSGNTSAVSAGSSGGTCDINKPPQTDASGAPISCSCPQGYSHPYGLDGTTKISNECVQNKTSIDCPSGRVSSQDPTKCAQLGSDCSNPGSTAIPAQNCLKNSPLINDLNTVVNFLAGAVGVVVIAVIIIGGIQYTLAGDNATATSDAKKRIINGLVALAAFIFMYAFLQWIIPGGV